MQPSRKLVHPKENLVVVQISTYEFLHGHGFTNPSQTHGFEFDVCRNSYTIESLDSLVTSYFQRPSPAARLNKQKRDLVDSSYCIIIHPCRFYCMG